MPRERMVPIVPLQNLFEVMQTFRGNPEEKFAHLQNRLRGRRGPVDHEFLAELFVRSKDHASHYDNANEPFHPPRTPLVNMPSNFAKQVEFLLATERALLNVGNRVYGYVDHEIHPFNTTLSCKETGEAASSAGRGYLDLLLTLKNHTDTLPVIGEIKAATETVGVTYALIQSLMCASQIATRNQFARLSRHYPAFAALNSGHPRIDLMIILQKQDEEIEGDLRCASDLSRNLSQELAEFIREITILKCTIEENRTIAAEVIAQYGITV